MALSHTEGHLDNEEAVCNTAFAQIESLMIFIILVHSLALLLCKARNSYGVPSGTSQTQFNAGGTDC